MASSEVAFEEFKLQNTTAAIYVLDKTLYELAEKIKKLLTKDCEITVCDKGSNDHWSEHVGNTIAQTAANFKNCQHKSLHTYEVGASTDVSIRDYGYLEKLKIEAKGRYKGRRLHHDVIILLGHSSVLLAEDKDLIETFTKLNPTIIAFVGCCGGNTRYGPILTMSYMLCNISKFEWEIPVTPSPIIAFYQRQVYMKELDSTSLIIGLKYYLHVVKYHFDYGKQLACYAFAWAKLDQSVSPTDPTVFINDRNEKNLFQKFFNRYPMTTNIIPLSCMQLGLYNSLVTKSDILEHKLVIDDVLWQLDQKEINITLHGITQKTKITNKDPQEIKIFGTLPKQITISEETKKDNPQWTETVTINLQGIKITFKTLGKRKICEDPEGIQITFQQEIAVIKNQGIKILFSYPCATKVSQDQQDIKMIATYQTENGEKIDQQLSKICWEKIEELQLHEILPLIYEIKLIKLYKKTLDLLRTSLWEKIDHLQFFVAVLRGYWGKNSLSVIKSWATFHLMKIKENVIDDSPKFLHQYKLCCVCFVLLFEDSFVRFVKLGEDNDKFGIIVCIKQENKLVDVTDEKPCKSYIPFSTDDLLSGWADLFQHCEYINKCVHLYNEPTHPAWTVGNRYGIDTLQQENQYHYTYAEFLLAMGALSDGCQARVRALINECQITRETLRKICYHVSTYENVDDKEKGYVKCFSDDPASIDQTIVEELGLCRIDGVSCIETRLLLHCSKELQKNVDLDTGLLDSYKNDTAITVPLADASTLCNEEAIQQIIENTKKQMDKIKMLDQTFRKTFQQGIDNALHQAISDHQIKNTLQCRSPENWKKVSFCRFVFAQFMTHNKDEIKGILFYTDTHYGDKLIVFNKEQLHELEKCTCYDTSEHDNCFQKVTALVTLERTEPVPKDILADAVKMLKGPCRYRMLQIAIEQMKHEKIFPFVKVGRLTLTYKNGQLTGINLDECAEHVAMEKYKADASVDT